MPNLTESVPRRKTWRGKEVRRKQFGDLPERRKAEEENSEDLFGENRKGS